MDDDRIKGKAKDIAGRVERQVGEWTGDKDAQAEGTEKQVEGKVQSTFGKVKDGARDLREKLQREKDEHTSDKDKKEEDVA